MEGQEIISRKIMTEERRHKFSDKKYAQNIEKNTTVPKQVIMKFWNVMCLYMSCSPKGNKMN